jgi:hypothetical protein
MTVLWPQLQLHLSVIFCDIKNLDITAITSHDCNLNYYMELIILRFLFWSAQGLLKGISITDMHRDRTTLHSLQHN